MNKHILLFSLSLFLLSSSASAGRLGNFWRPSVWVFHKQEVQRGLPFVTSIMATYNAPNRHGLIAPVLNIQEDDFSFGYWTTWKAKLKDAGLLNTIFLNKRWETEMNDVTSHLATAMALNRLVTALPNDGERMVVKDEDEATVLPLTLLVNFEELIKANAKKRFLSFAKRAYLTREEIAIILRQAENEALVRLRVSEHKSEKANMGELLRGIDDYLDQGKHQCSNREQLLSEARSLVYDVVGFFIRTPRALCNLTGSCVRMAFMMKRLKAEDREQEKKKFMSDIDHL